MGITASDRYTVNPRDGESALAPSRTYPANQLPNPPPHSSYGAQPQLWRRILDMASVGAIP
jgi:hypothetical protein